MLTIDAALKQGVLFLKALENPRLEAMRLLAKVLSCDFAFFYTWPEKYLSEQEAQIYLNLIEKRAQGYPLAYLLGEWGFWDFSLKVSPDTLIPRPETEIVVEWVLERFAKQDDLQVADLGTGTGAIALALARTKPAWVIWGIDISPQALKIAKENAKALAIEHITWLENNWLHGLSLPSLDCIIANPPYLSITDPHLQMGDLPYEPYQALVSGPSGLEAFEEIALLAKKYLKPGGILVFEHGCTQGLDLRTLLQEQGYKEIGTVLDLSGHERLSYAVFS